MDDGYLFSKEAVMNMTQCCVSYKELEDIGANLVRDFYRKTDTDYSLMFVDVETMALMMGLKIVYEDLVPDVPIKLAFLSNGYDEIQVIRDGLVESVVFPKKTIVVDLRLKDNDNIGRLRFTIAHEIAHHFLIKHKFFPDTDMNYDLSSDEIDDLMYQEEKQADRLASAILMPKFFMKRLLDEMNSGNPIIIYGTTTTDIETKCILIKMSELIGVSYTALLIRLKELYMVEYHDFSEYFSSSSIDIWRDDD
ncbi:MAG: ImmA/IrrE family metallo-endopeptidase [Clostridia bacterium]|nr:ImmA/IrrE family metallo-endopeptidase [Clostridia bacterium]